eukprot:gene11234-15074_t
MQSPLDLKKSRQLKALASGDESNDILDRPSSSSSRPNSIAGRRSEERIAKKRQRDDANNFLLSADYSVDNILKSTGSSSLRPISQEKPFGLLSSLKKESENKSQLNASGTAHVPNSRLGNEVPIGDNTSMFGSTQLNGCQGDFCSFDLQYLEPTDLIDISSGPGTFNKAKSVSDFQKRIVTTTGQSNFFDINNRVSTGSSSNKSEQSIEANMKIAMKSIIHARQELPLVKLQLERHKRGDAGPYVNEDNYQDLAVSGKLPAHYYQEVPCCLTCYKVYNIVDKARAKAMKVLNKKKSSNKKLTEAISKHVSNDVKSTISAKEIQQSALIDEDSAETLAIALNAIDGLTKMDVAEIRTMAKPPAAVEVVMEAVMILLTGKAMPFKEVSKLLLGGEAFLTMLREFDIKSVTEERLRLIEPYVDNPLFRPENVVSISYCASKFCAWVHGIVHAVRWDKGLNHKRIDIIRPNKNKLNNLNDKNSVAGYLKPITKSNGTNNNRNNNELTFIEKLEKIKASKVSNLSGSSLISRNMDENNASKIKNNMKSSNSSKLLTKSIGTIESMEGGFMSRSMNRLDPGPSPDVNNLYPSDDEKAGSGVKKLSKRESKAVRVAQQKATDRLSSANILEGGAGTLGSAKSFRCADGITKMPYMVLGKFSLTVQRCSFVVIHDFFDTYDGTAILFKPIVHRHDGCQALCFNYPGQSNTVWPRLSAVEREHGAKEPNLNNDWIADRIHELLQFAESSGDILLSCPFHVVGIGNGACIAAAFMQKYGNNKLYVKSIRSMVSINGFLYPDPQLSSILHSAYQIFESTPHSRPDIPVSYWSRFVFSDEYLLKINPNLALNIYTAVSNPITNEGRAKIAKGCLQSRDIRGGLAPDFINNNKNNSTASKYNYKPVQVPIILLQSTENALVNASNVDSFLTGRTSKHLWSHMLNVPSDELLSHAYDTSSSVPWVGKLSSGPEDYHKYNTLGKNGIKMLLESLRNPRGAFTMWTRTGHAINQEYKAAILDLLDILACPTDEYAGVEVNGSVNSDTSKSEYDLIDESSTKPSVRLPPKVDVIFKLEPPKPVKPAERIMSEEELIGSDVLDSNYNQHHIDRYDDGDVKAINIEAPAPVTSSVPRESLAGEDKTNDMFDDMNLRDTMKHEELNNYNNVDDSNLNNDKSSESKSTSGAGIQAKPFVLPPSNPRPTVPTAATVHHNSQPPLSSSASQAKKHNNNKVNFNDVTEKDHERGPQLIKDIVDGREIMNISSDSQRNDQLWVSSIPPITDALLLEAELEEKRKEYLKLLEKQAEMKEIESNERIEKIEKSQAIRRQQFENEDKKLLDKLQHELDLRQKERDFAEKQRRLQLQEIEKTLIQEGLVPSSSSIISDEKSNEKPVMEMIPLRYDEPTELPKILTEEQDINSKLDRMLIDEKAAKSRGVMKIEDYETIKFQMAERQLERDQKLRHLSQEELQELYDDNSIHIQRIVRGFNGRNKAKRANELRELKKLRLKSIILIQRTVRGMIGRKRFMAFKRIYLLNLRSSHSAITIQRTFRGYYARRYFRRIKRIACALRIQKFFRGYLGRLAFKQEKKRLEIIKLKHNSAAKVQSIWRMKVSKEEFRSMRVHILATIEIQRVYRGYLGRKKIARRKQWENTPPGPDRIKLGLQFIEESKVAFERQQEEIDALHRAQERAEARISLIHHELKDSEKELVVLERELQEIDQIERDLNVLTHERNVLIAGIEDATGIPKTAVKGHKDLIFGRESNKDNDPIAERKRKAEAYALEMTIQIKRAEREKKRQELEIEFAAVFAEVEKKKKALQRLELSLSDMESTRERKDREFRRLQKNLMQLLLEQKQELDDLREKETASATSAAAAVATAQKAKEHEMRSTAMFSQTEELMKFQFMSMSLSYFSSLNMLKSLRDMNADTTSAAVSLSADAAATAASAAAAANLPNFKKLNLGANDFLEGSIQKKKAELAVSEKAEKEFNSTVSNPLPVNVRTWSVMDVSRWLDSLSLSQYGPAFVEASIDGPFLMELREEDLVQVLNVKHKLHVRKVLLSRDKLKPLTSKEKAMKEIVDEEDAADIARRDIGVPTLDTVFIQARNGRIKRVEESLNLGFGIESEDERGNTLLLIAAQNRNKRLVEMLLIRGANINHQNAQGNTALHFALAFDSEGILGEYLIEHGADDTIENIDGLTPYDGVATG